MGRHQGAGGAGLLECGGKGSGASGGSPGSSYVDPLGPDAGLAMYQFYYEAPEACSVRGRIFAPVATALNA